MEHKQTTVTFNEWRYNQPGETHDDQYHVGDAIVSRIYSGGKQVGKLTGIIAEILVCQRRDIYKIKVESGWCTDPRSDEVEVVKQFIV